MCNDKLKFTHFAIVPKQKKDMKLKAIKYLLPTTDGRLHKELSYLISLHENKMNKGKLENQISDLEHKFKQLEHNYREACLELADRDNESDLVIELQKFLKVKDDYIQKHLARPIESTQELFTSEDDNHKNPTFIVAPTPDPITSTTLKTPNEWLKLMSDEEVKDWVKNRDLCDKTH